jgi:ABC-type lipoprotein export system ATPase subunit
MYQVINLYRTVFVDQEWCVLLTGRYYNAVHSCLLTEDVDKLPKHDDTQIDEMVLSAGQKQRIALARALYSNRWDMWSSEPLWQLLSQCNTIIGVA